MGTMTLTAEAVVDPAEIVLTDHCRDRFNERARPTLEPGAALRELRRLVVEQGVVGEHAPAWLTARQRAEPADLYLTVADDFAIPLRWNGGRFARLVAVTFLTRTGISDLARARRNGRTRD
ncbi:MAG: hypothetical protein ACRDKX_07255, partial [Solirubrobacterales bacterium]